MDSRVVTHRSIVFAVLVLMATFGLVAPATPAFAMPVLGDSWIPTRLRDAWDRTIQLTDVAGKATLVIYEDKGSATMNRELKRALGRLAETERYRTRATLLAVADVAVYGYWPVRGFVKRAIRSESAEQRTNIYCDWDGAFRRTLSLRAGTSNVVFYSRSGTVLFAHAGPLSPEERELLLELLHRETE